MEDRPADAELVTRELRKARLEFAAKKVMTGKEFLADYSQPGYDGLSALAAAQKQCPETPFIFVSGSMGEEKAVETLHRGATDYVLKQRLARLGPAVRRALREHEERRKREQAEKERHEAEERVRELNLVLRATGAINALMARERDPRRLLAEACKILVETRGYELAWIGQVEPGSKRVVSAARAGKDADYLDAVTITWDDTPAGRGPTGTAIRTGQPAVCQDMAADPRFAPWKEAAVARGFASMAAMPMIHGTRVLGAVSVYSDCAGAFNAEELDLLKELAADLAFALQSIEHEQERKRAEESLHESSQFNQQIVASAQEGIVVYGRDLKYHVWNPFMEQLTGISADQVLGRHPDELFPFLRETGLLASIERILAGEPASSIDIHIESLPTGRANWTSQTNGPLRNAAGEIIAVIGIVRDMTERKRAELRITAFSNLGQRLSAAKTAREATEIISEVAGELLGWDACSFSLCVPSSDRLNHVLQLDTVDGRRVDFDPGYAPPSALARRAIEAGGQLILKEKPDEMLPGSQPFGNSTRPSASIMYVPVRKGTEVIGVMSIQSYKPGAYDSQSLETLQALADHCVGALDRLRMEAELQRSHEQYRRAIAAANAIPYQKMYGADTYVFMGEGIKELTGYAPAELSSKVWKEMILETVFLGEAAGLPLAEAARRTLADEIKHWRADHRIRTRSGAIRWISDSSVQLFDADSKPTGSMGIIQDLTERKEIEVQLRQSQKMDAVSQLAGGVAQDFNNMLAVIRGNAELLLMDEAQLTAETTEGLKHVVEASERAANLTRQLLAFSRKQVLQPQPLILNEVIANLTKMLNRVIGENINLQCHYAALLPYVLADTGMIEQVILNLVVNARDAMPVGGQLWVTTEPLTLDEADALVNPEARAGEFVCLLVSDTGTGIAPGVLPRIFEPFFTTKDVSKGTGLGLATVYGIVQQHQGWIEVSSRVGKGSTFKVVLPAISTPAGLGAAAEAETEIPGGKETILLVEDDHAVRLTTRRVLESKGYTIREAKSAREALEVWQSHAGEIALLLTDIMMPEQMTGRDLAEQLCGQRPGLKVIFMSGYSTEVLGTNTEFIRRTRSCFLQKPSTSRVILETVRRCLDEKDLAAPPGEAAGTI